MTTYMYTTHLYWHVVYYQARCWLAKVVSSKREPYTPQASEEGLLTYLCDSINKLLGGRRGGGGGGGGSGDSEPTYLATVLLLAVDAEYSEETQ